MVTFLELKIISFLGGKDDDSVSIVFNDVWFFDPIKKNWIEKETKFPIKERWGHVSVIYADWMFVFGIYHFWKL